MVESKIICIPVDYRQEKFIEKEFPPGICMALGVCNGKWHIGSRPAQGGRLEGPPGAHERG